ncbi:PREDICTED: polyadenylate-binding protein-interacting protein 4-like [Camelina sativa]|uniref:Polyadenylate-binding protein-interacting protein 4-like n=1 Tax=Camelina sativa TaxID=90675 RepID=A0ABM0XK77_CAMSA|nr:PREDICTED: polyadenylate-binding protein-interacting protein 4-like [Camelina sativa]
MSIQPIQSENSSNGEPAFNGEAGSLKRLSNDRLVYLTTCKIGHPVEVHLKNGSMYSGIFHAADVEKDYGIILKMACLIKEGTLRGHKSRSEFVRKPPSKTFIIPADELVQVVAKDLSVSWNGMSNAVQSEKPGELLTDSSISQSYHVDRERQLKPWVPDESVPQRADLENVFDSPWNRKWNQFEANESLFGVKSTFDEELYTTKLERGAQSKELEEQARRIANEIEGETTRDLHVAEERGLQFSVKSDFDEEARYSSVRRVTGLDDSGLSEKDNVLLDIMTFGSLTISQSQELLSGGKKGCEESWGDSQSLRDNTNVDQSCSTSKQQSKDRGLDDSGLDEEDNVLLDIMTFGSLTISESQELLSGGKKGCQESWGDSQSSRDNRNVDQSCSTSKQQSKDLPAAGSSISESQLDERRRTNNDQEVSHNNRSAEESTSGHGDINESVKIGGGATSASKAVTERESQVSQGSGQTKSESSFGQSASRSSESRPVPSTSSRPGLSPSSSIGSMTSSEKSTLNPNAKEFKFNPNAKSFKPAQPAAARPQAPIPDPSFYYPGPNHVAPVQQMPGMPPVNYGVPPYPGNQPPMMMYHPQAYYHPGGQPQYPQQQMVPGQQQQMIPGQQQPRPVYYTHQQPPPPYEQDMQYHNQGRE